MAEGCINCMRAMLAAIMAAAVALALAAAPAAAKSVPVAGSLAGDQALWASYVGQFVTPDGRVIDNVNGGISHTESQGYGMLLAVAAGDREVFQRIWAFTEAQMYIRDDGLGSWKWQPASVTTAEPKGAIADPNNATDGDILIAWALAEAGAAGFGDEYTARARAIVTALEATIYDLPPFGLQIMPGRQGFSAEERDGRPVVNLSYWVFPAFQRLAELAPAPFWTGLAESGWNLIVASSSFSAALPPDWMALDPAKGALSTAPGFDDGFSYNAIRIPLYLAMTGPGSRRVLRAGFEHWFAFEGPLHTVGVNDRALRDALVDPGYEAIRALYGCVTRGATFPQSLTQSLDTNYYPATLQLLALMAVRQSFPQCVS
ncbi:MAG: glycosyl hydrolase family 8 [Rhizobiaceae bacterium]|jgi:endoglucanase|nr:glycosyl hydrolase family 8 [Rhizobiaceae bacterium]